MEKLPSLHLHSTTRCGDSFHVSNGAPLDVYACVFYAELWVLSLSVEEGRSTFGVMARIYRPNFKGLPKVSRVATNHWVFLRCDWSLVSN